MLGRFFGKKPATPPATPPAPAPEAAPASQAAPAPAVEPAHDPGPEPLKGKRVTVFGFAASGRAAARLALREGAEVMAVDEGDPEALRTRAAEVGGVTAHTGDPAGALAAADLVVLSPGVPMAHPAVQAAKAKGVPVIAEVELAARYLSAPLIGITGTNGKSTVTAMTGHVLSGWKPRVFTGGNLGRPLSEAALDPEPWDLVVCELSSFQLEGTLTLTPAVACIVNTAPDHLDRYDGESAYYMAKFRLFAHMKGGYALLNARDPRTPMVVEHYLPEGVRPVRFHLPEDAPEGADGVRVRDGAITVTTGGRTLVVTTVDRLRVVGAQNVENAQAAAALCLLAGCPLPVVAEGLATFEGLPHRMQAVAEVDGVRFIDDSKATNPAAVVKALEGLEGPVTILLGGRDKGGDLFALREPVFTKARRAIVFGEAAEKFRVVLQGFAGLTVVAGLKDAVAQARAEAVPGETVLLSPACASFDEFRDYAHRGDMFAAWARGRE